MEGKVLGLRKLDFETNDGKQIKGVKIFVSYRTGNSFDEGEICDSLFISETSKVQLPEFSYGKEYNFVFETTGLSGKSHLVKILNKDGTAPKMALKDSGFPFQ